MIGGKLKALRESKGLLQREVAAKLDVDTAYISKMESDEKPVSRSYLKRLARLFDVTEEELLTVWLADRIYDVAKDETVAIKALKAAEQEILNKSK
jgi:transcriptional regulator with XRE-family HTH domain